MFLWETLIDQKQESDAKGRQTHTPGLLKPLTKRAWNFIKLLYSLICPKENQEHSGINKPKLAAAAEADLNQHFKRCQKNPGHSDFIPVTKFNIEHLPVAYQDKLIFEFITAIQFLTVRLCCRFISFDRPQTYPNTDAPFPFYNNRGFKCLRTATGFVGKVTAKNTALDQARKRSPQDQNQYSSTSKASWYEVTVYTAQHAVFDEFEAKSTTCQLFYDRDEEKDKIQELKGETVLSANLDCDRCWMLCYIDDLELGKKLKDMCEKYYSLCKKIQKFSIPSIRNPLTVIVSHPHGCSKQITIGELTYKEKIHNQCSELQKSCSRYTYTAQTCPGSSGAPVHTLGFKKKHKVLSNPHIRRCQEDGFNMSVATSNCKPSTDKLLVNKHRNIHQQLQHQNVSRPIGVAQDVLKLCIYYFCIFISVLLFLIVVVVLSSTEIVYLVLRFALHYGSRFALMVRAKTMPILCQLLVMVINEILSNRLYFPSNAHDAILTYLLFNQLFSKLMTLC